ncbi:transcriptional regulator PpsR [Roseisolibacter sp. H3M3-2]|uniref:transcriptional regulator PpsR n=1 Tax=Roseisolibacter sp. H3M3-2 TaxID=3031323 RepID=UPI0023DC3D34|nr:transcriptional regulator PpsR [Roseisolibacter sp. H3M3-2]MDF1501848.1 transcriptional regulator PpsR [Roseisolibacter sp. H3M3-2]
MAAPRAPARATRAFSGGRTALAHLEPEAASVLVSASDLAFIVDREGVVRDLALGSGDPTLAQLDAWVGRRWIDTVVADSRPKIEAMLRDVAASGHSPKRQVNHVTPDGTDLPVAYTAVRLGESGSLVASGRDLRALAQMQQRLVETQQAMERDYWRLRHVETRYRLLFQLSSEAVLVLDGQTRKVVDANAAAGTLFGVAADRLVGRAAPLELDRDGERALDRLLTDTRRDGRADEVALTLRDGLAVRASASCFRQDAQTLFLLRLATPAAARAAAPRPAVVDLLAQAPDAFVVTTPAGEILSANRAFLDLVEVGEEAQVLGRPIADWMGRPGADVPVLLSMLRKHGALRLVATAARGQLGAVTEVEVSAVLAADAEVPSVAFVIRDVSRRVAGGVQGARDLTRAVENLTTLVGRVSLPELLRETTELVERHFIEAALELTHDNRTAAAEVLGLSRQSLYLKLRRHKLSSGDAEAEQGQG